MIVEALVGAGLLVAGTAAVRAFLRRRAERKGGDPDEAKRGAKAKSGKPKAATTKAAPTDDAKPEKKKKRRWRREAPVVSSGPRGLRVDDVLLYEDTELWLAGVLELEEEGLVARLFPTPGALRAEWVAQLDPEARDVAVLRTTDVVPAGAVPEALPCDGRRLTLERRGAAEVRSEGEHLPRVETKGRYTLLSDAAGRVLFVVDFEKAPRLALLGDRVGKHMLDLPPGGDPDEE